MKVSIIIVSYNVKYFLEQCLCSVIKALDEWSVPRGESCSEVIVIDNNSNDGSIEYIRSRFPLVQVISNTENLGFAKANNQASRLATGEYILFLNPDTILPENFFTKSLPFLESSPMIGAAGVQMIDRTGRFLKESKRGFPTSWASFCKLSGLTALFPKSKIFAKYYVGHIDEKSTHEVDALSGACMVVRKDLIDKAGGFDERFFMYAEDIDLSFRIRQLGYKNFYLADITIIHFKGESTTKDRRYVHLFYKAMIQFVEKHYTGFAGRIYADFLKMAIWSRALLSFGKIRLRKKTSQPLSRVKTIFFLGDESSIAEIKSTVPYSINLEGKARDADEIILCEGKNFSFQNIIDEMKQSPRTVHRIHASGTSRAV